MPGKNNYPCKGRFRPIKEILTDLITFFRNYADKFHHYKEEKLLFPLMCEKNDMLENSIIAEMLDNHQDFRN